MKKYIRATSGLYEVISDKVETYYDKPCYKVSNKNINKYNIVTVDSVIDESDKIEDLISEWGVQWKDHSKWPGYQTNLTLSDILRYWNRNEKHSGIEKIFGLVWVKSRDGFDDLRVVVEYHPDTKTFTWR